MSILRIIFTIEKIARDVNEYLPARIQYSIPRLVGKRLNRFFEIGNHKAEEARFRPFSMGIAPPSSCSFRNHLFIYNEKENRYHRFLPYSCVTLCKTT